MALSQIKTRILLPRGTVESLSAREFVAGELVLLNNLTGGFKAIQITANGTGLSGAAAAKYKDLEIDLAASGLSTYNEIIAQLPTDGFAKKTDVTAEIEKLDVTDSPVANKFVTAVSETDGKISVTRAQPTINDIDGLSTEFANYYKKSETSSVNELTAKFADYYTKSDVDSISSALSAQATTDINAAKSEVVGNAADLSSADTVYGAKKYADIIAAASEVTVEKLTTATAGYASSYVVKQNGVQVGATIDIPKDYLVKSATLSVVKTADEPYSGAAVGDKYIDFVVNAKDDSGTASHIYLPVNDLVDAYTGVNGTTINVTVDNSNQISAEVKDDSLTMAKFSSTETFIFDCN